MAIIVSTNAYITIGGTNYSDHARMISVDDGQNTREVSTMTTGTPFHRFRAGQGTPSIEAEFFADESASILAALRGMVTTTTSGVLTVEARKVNSSSTTSNPTYSMDGILDGPVKVLDEKVGDVPMVSVRFKPYSVWTISTTATS